ncbi:MAG: hypothetical protein PVG24_07955 [Gammaproteobacteria bacterium]|jgi:hypothetical protein
MLRNANRRTLALAICLATLLLAAAQRTVAQPGPGPRQVLSARESAPIDLTGQWVAIVNEDWRWRMRTPPKGDYSSVQTLNAAGRAVADEWDVSQDGSCLAYGAAGIMRMPTRLRIAWDGDDRLIIATDAGAQTRELHFGAAQGAHGMPASLQGYSVARWERTLPPPGPMGFTLPPGLAPPTNGGSLEVVTTNLREAWLRRNGVPYSAQTTLTEYFDRFDTPGGDQWFVVTSIVEDPLYHNGRFITSSHFRREDDESRWNPTSCRE